MGLYDAVQALVKGSRSEITSPVVVFPICVGKEISTEHWVACRPGSLGHSGCFVYSIEVVGESPKLRLFEHVNTRNKILKKSFHHWAGAFYLT